MSVAGTVLVYAEHDNASLKDATLAVVTVAAKLGEVHVLVAGSGCGAAADAAAKITGVAKVLKADDAAYGAQLAENVAPLVASLMASYDAFLAPATAHGKNIAPRVAASLDVMQISDILSVEGPKTFTRPTYAGNAIATVESNDIFDAVPGLPQDMGFVTQQETDTEARGRSDRRSKIPARGAGTECAAFEHGVDIVGSDVDAVFIKNDAEFDPMSLSGVDGVDIVNTTVDASGKAEEEKKRKS